MITGAAFCPHPPVLLPEVAAGAAGELDTLRAACRTAIRRAVDGVGGGAAAERIVLIGAGPMSATYGAPAHGTLRGYGVDVSAGLDGLPGRSGRADRPVLPLSLTVGAWLVHDAVDADRELTAIAVAEGDPPGWDEPAEPTALVVLGDGSARRSVTAPGYLDDAAGPFDADVAAALATGDAGRLRHLDAAAGAALLAAGVTAWRFAGTVLADTVPADTVPADTVPADTVPAGTVPAAGGFGDGRWAAELLYDDAPYGVGYLVAAWSRAAAP